MVARRSSSDFAGLPSEEALQKALAQCEAEVDSLREQLAGLRSSGGQFLSDGAHAIRSPLTVTHSYLEILHTDLREGLTEEQQTFLGIAYENADKLRRLVDDLVDLAALETGTAQIELAPARVGDIVEGVRAELEPSVAEIGIELTTEVAANLPSATVDEEQLKNVLRRLIGNAVRFSHDGGSVLLRASSDQNNVIFEIIDTGVGIPDGRVTDALEPFVQLHRKPGENREGYGLGLPLSRSIVEAFGGTIEIGSIEGEGTTVTIRTPAGPSQ